MTQTYVGVADRRAQSYPIHWPVSLHVDRSPAFLLARLNGSQAVAVIACQEVPGIPWSKPGMAAGLKVALGLTREAAGAPDQDSDATALTEMDG